MTIRLVHEHVPAVHDDFPAVACRLCQLAAPRSVALYQCLEELRRHRVLRPEKIVADTTGGLVAGEAVKPFCAATPVNDRSRESPHEDRIVSLFQQVITSFMSRTKTVSCVRSRSRACSLSTPSARFRSSMSIVVPYHLTMFPRSRSGTARNTDQRYSPSARRSRASFSNGSPAAQAARPSSIAP